MRCDFPLSNATYVSAGAGLLHLGDLRVFCAPHGSYAKLAPVLSKRSRTRAASTSSSATRPHGILDLTYQKQKAGSKALLGAVVQALRQAKSAGALGVRPHPRGRRWPAVDLTDGRGAPTTVVNAAAANAGRAKRLERGAVGVNVALGPKGILPPAAPKTRV